MILLGELLLDLWFLVFFILSVILFRLIRHFLLLLLDSHGLLLLLIRDELHLRHLIGKKVLVILEELLLLLLSVFVELGELVEDHAALGYAVFI